MTIAALEHHGIVDTIERSADPAAARAGLERLVEARPEIADELVADGRLRDAVVAVICASRALTNDIVRLPSLLDALHDGDDLVIEAPRATYERRARAFGAFEDTSATALRRWKRREYVRIAARDLLGLADMPTVGRELAGVAEVCLDAALELVTPTVALAVVGMGKLGGHELNYASDVDILFVHDGDDQDAQHAARALLAVMITPTPDGIVHRTDADLRPEGRAGALSRNLASYQAWYERWARPWEFQALIKARPAAGAAELGAALVSVSRPFVWPDVLDPDAVREVREMKRRSEAELVRKGMEHRELKRGRGGIRDVEFAVQLLQMVHGRHDETIRSPTTLDALDQLAGGGYVERADATRLGGAYVFLRNVEHRLQLWDEQQTHTLPTDEVALSRLARVLGYRDTPRRSAYQRFDEEQRSHQAEVRAIHERLFFAPLLDTLSGRGPLTDDAAQERLAAFGFADAEHTRTALRDLTRGFRRSSRVLSALLPVILDWLSASPDADLGLLQLRRLAEGTARATALATTFRDQPGAAERTCRVLGSSRLVGDALLHQPEVVELLGDDQWLVPPRAAEALRAAALETLHWRADPGARRDGLRRFKRRELLRIAARDVLGLAPPDTTATELADLADACVEAALRGLEPSVAFSVIGMGRLGGRELSYASDIDVLFVYDSASPDDSAAAERLATGLMGEIGATTAEGQTFRIDANLRPEGKQGPLARSLESYRRYYERWALTWEVQSLTRVRPVAGDADLGARFAAMVLPFVYRDPFPLDEAREVRRIKARVERERIPPSEDAEFHFKLGRGGLTDIEFTVQLLQLEHGAQYPSVREPSTMRALAALRAGGLVDPEDADVLTDAYAFCERARNASYLVMGKGGDALPTGPPAARIARLLGYGRRPESELRDNFRRRTRRARRVVERLFYGRP